MAAKKRKEDWKQRYASMTRYADRLGGLVMAAEAEAKRLMSVEREVLELRAQLKAAQESAQTYAHRFHQMEDKNVELDAEADRLKRTDTELREEVRRLRKEAADHPAVVEKLQADLKAERHRVAELRQKNDLQLAQVRALREQLGKAQEEAERREMERRKTLQPQTPQTAPQTCRCSEHEERLRALLERVVSLESRMDAVSAASRPRRIFEGGG